MRDLLRQSRDALRELRSAQNAGNLHLLEMRKQRDRLSGRVERKAQTVMPVQNAVPQDRRRWPRLFAACAIMVSIGFIYGWSVFSTPLAAEFGWDPTTISFTFTVLMWAFCAGGIVGSKVARKTSPRCALIVSATGIFMAFALTATLIRPDAPWVMYVAYGALGGGCVGMAYTTTMGATIPWFPDRTGFASGMLLLCYGMSTMILGSVATALFAAIGWRWSFVALSASIAVAIGLLSLAIKNPRSDEVRRTRTRSNEAPDASAPETTAVGTEFATADMLKRPVFYLYAAWMVSVSSIGLGLIGSANQVALDIGAAIPLAAFIVGTLSVCNGLGRLATGFAFDLLGISATMAVVAAAHIAGCLFIAAAIVQHSVALMVVGAIVGGLGIGGTSVVGSGFIARAFGEAHYAEYLSILNLSLIPAALAGPLVMSSSASGPGSYLAGVAALAAIGLIALALSRITKAFLTRRG